MSFGTGFGATASAPQSTFSFGSATSTAATPAKPSTLQIIANFFEVMSCLFITANKL